MKRSPVDISDQPGFALLHYPWESWKSGHASSLTSISEGYGKIFLAQLIKEAKRIGINRLLITCDAANFRSRRVIESNNEVLELSIEITSFHCRLVV